MLAVLLISFSYLLYGADFEYSYAGFGALLAIPFAIGAIVCYSSQQFSILGCLVAPIILFGIIFPFVYFGLAEGLVCILMVLPFWLVAGIGGGIFTWLNNQGRNEAQDNKTTYRVQVTALAVIPLTLMVVEQASPPEWQAREVSREVLIEATPEEIWPLLISIPGISANEGKATLTHDLLGFARPKDAELVYGNGQMVRRARWGDQIQFEEHIVEITPGQEIEWKFAFTDGSVQAYTDHHISPDGPILKIDRGGYHMEQITPDATRVTLWTTYKMRSRLDWYLEIWGEQILGDIEDNVLEIIRIRSENSISL